MTDTHTIEAAYERLATALIPPAASESLLTSHLARRRRRRRTAQGAGTALAVAALAGGALALTGGGADPRVSTAVASSASPTSYAATPTSDATPDAEQCVVTLDPPARTVDPTLDRVLRMLAARSLPGARVERDGERLTITVLDDDGSARFRMRVVDDGGTYRDLEVATCR